MTDIWHDIHRVRLPRKVARGCNTHPCETPERLIDRIIRLTTNPGDVVLDAFAGTGATALVARRLDRRFIAIEQDDDYLNAASRRVSEYKTRERTTQSRVRRAQVSRRSLQVELQRLALSLGRLPTKADVEFLSRHRLSTFEGAFDSWSEALKAAKIVVGNASSQGSLRHDEQLEMFSAKSKPIERSESIELAEPSIIDEPLTDDAALFNPPELSMD